MQTCPHSGFLVVDTRPLLDIVFDPTDCAHISHHQTETLVPSTGNESMKHHKHEEGYLTHFFFKIFFPELTNAPLQQTKTETFISISVGFFF